MYRQWVAILSGAVSGALGGTAALFAGLGCLYSIALFAAIGILGIFLQPFVTDASQEVDWALILRVSLVFCGLFAASVGSLVGGIVLRLIFRHSSRRWATYYLVLGFGVWPIFFLYLSSHLTEGSIVVMGIVSSCIGVILGSVITLWCLFTTSDQYV